MYKKTHDVIFDNALGILGELYEAQMSDARGFDQRLTNVASLHSPKDNTTCEECHKPHPCPTLKACD